MFVGDINLGEYYTSFGHGPATYMKTGNVFDAVKGILCQADIVAGNLEAPLTTQNLMPAEPESMVLRGSPKNAPVLRSAGFNVLQVANNHTLQHGKEGFNATVKTLKAAGIKVIGLNGQDVAVLKLDGVKIGFFAASDVPDNTDKQQQSYQRLEEKFVKKIKDAVSLVDHLFVMFHWGLETSTSPTEYQIKLSRELIACNVRGVIGSHPHLFYEAWLEGKGVIAPSLGNFVFDLCWDDRLIKTGILDVQIIGNGIKAQIWPVTIMKNGCLPTPTGNPVPLSPSVKLYDLGRDMRDEQARKLKYFFRNFWKGKRLLKLKFINRKLTSSLKKLLVNLTL